MKKLIFILTLALITLAGFSCQRAPRDLSVYRTQDTGTEWQQKATLNQKQSISTVSVMSIAVDSKNPNNIFIGTLGKGVLRSQNSADSWQQTNLKQGNFYSIAVDPKNDKIVYACGSIGNLGKIYKSEDGGQEFKEVYSETHPKKDVKTIAIDNYDTKKVYAGVASGAFLKSVDSGKSWIAIKWFDAPIKTIAISPKDSRIILVSTQGQWLFKTTDGGNQWQNLKENLSKFRGANNVFSIAFDNKNRETVYIGSRYGLLKSLNEGSSWEAIPLVVKEGKISSLSVVIDPKNPKNIFLGLDSTIHKSVDSGKNWTVKKITGNRITSVSIDPKNPQNVYAGVEKIEQ